MTNTDIDQIYAQFLGMGHTAALKAIYTLGYSNGAGTTIDGNLIDQAKAATKPTTAQMASMTSNPKLKRVD